MAERRYFDDERDREDHRDRAPGSSGSSSSGGNVLTKMMGPIPVWGWLIVVVGAFYLYRKFTSSSSSASSATSPASNAAAPTAYSGGTIPWTAPTGGGGYVPPGGGSPIATGTGGSGAPTPGGPVQVTSPGSTGSTAPGTLTMVSTPQQVQTDLNTGVPVYYEPPGGATPSTNPAVPITQPGGPGGEWEAGNQPLPPGQGGTVWAAA